MPSGASRIGWSLSARLISGFLLVTLLSLSVMVAISLYALRDLTDVNHQLQEISRSLEAVQGLETAFAKAVTPLSAYLVDGTAGEIRRFNAAIDEVETRLQGCSGAACHGGSRVLLAIHREDNLNATSVGTALVLQRSAKSHGHRTVTPKRCIPGVGNTIDLEDVIGWPR